MPNLVIQIYETIGYDWWTDSGVTAKSVSADIERAGEFDELHFRINSPGGDAFEGIAIYNVARSCGKPVKVFVDGIAASSASIIAMAGDEIVMGPNTMMMIHNAWSWCIGEAKDMRKMAEALDKISGAIAQTYVTRTKKELDAVLSLMDAETWLTAQECLAEGFATAIAEADSTAEARALAMARGFKALAKMKRVPAKLRPRAEEEESEEKPDDPKCKCACIACMGGDCAGCDSEDCTDENCTDCPMQSSASALAAMNVDLARADLALAEVQKRTVI